jgi:aspartyl-tRNA(Asn)/glutamyl-tRNA(Gln) amidotransferase subunit A
VFSSVDRDDVIRQALASDDRHKRNATLGILDGVPVAFKDNTRVKGHVAFNGRKKETFGPQEVEKDDDTLVRRFREEGAIILGLTVMVEFGVSPIGYNSHWKGPVSVYGKNRHSGGSSSGSAVAVASGLVPIAIGFDGGGSIRIPGKKQTILQPMS